MTANRDVAHPQTYLRFIRERCSNAVHILDRFHIVANMNKALDEVRAGEARRLAQDGYEPVLKRTRWCVLKRKSNLTGKQRFRLRELLRYNLSVHPHMLKHACGFKLANDGRDTRPLQHYLGHKNIMHTVRSTDTRPLQDLLAGLSDWLGEVGLEMPDVG